MLADKDKIAEKNGENKENLETNSPMSERDEVKKAEERTRDLQKNAKSLNPDKGK